MSQLEELNSIIKVEFMKTAEPLRFEYIKILARELYNGDDLSSALRVLCASGKVKQVPFKGNFCFKPTNLEYLENMNKDSDMHEVSEDAIIEVIRIYGSGTPNQVAQRYLELKDSKANVETITRRMRSMAHEGKLNRIRNVYFLEKINTAEKELGSFS